MALLNVNRILGVDDTYWYRGIDEVFLELLSFVLFLLPTYGISLVDGRTNVVKLNFSTGYNGSFSESSHTSHTSLP